ncbi:MAG: GNAT family N-acetyltransferase [Thermodesulfobacteriota bacterium]
MKAYREKLLSADEALAAVKKGHRVLIGSGCGEPRHLVDRLAARTETLFDVEIIQVLSTGLSLYAADRLGEHFRVKNFFVAGSGAREAIWEGRADYIPMFMSRVPRLFTEKLVELDVALIQVSRPNERGYMSLGVAVDVAKEALAAADHVIAQVNPAMPVTLGDTFVHLSEIDTVVEYEEPLLEVREPTLGEKDLLVGGNVARLVEDGSTIHAGLGILPKAALEAMADKKDLGVHTDMLTDGYLDLIRKGVITNRKKNVNPNRIVASYCIGTKELFDFVHLNPFVELYPVALTNDPYLIGRHDQMISFHEALEVDLTGQVAASVGNHIYTGVGGMIDFMRGSFRSRNGKFIIALHATTPDESASRIIPALPAGSGVVGSRAAAHWVVTEFGAVNLQAKSLRERAVALIEIAHPKFREELYNQARDQGLLSQGDPISLFKPVVYPHEVEACFSLEDEDLVFRPAKATDLRSIQEFFYGLNDRDIHYRFLRSMKAFPRQEMAAMANIDYHHRMTILAVKGEAGFERVVAIGRYMAVESGDMVEVDVAVAEDYRRRGLGRSLLKYVFEIAKRRGFKGVLAYVAHDNPKTLKMVKSLGYKARATLNLGVYEIELRFDEPTDEPQMEIIYPRAR